MHIFLNMFRRFCSLQLCPTARCPPHHYKCKAPPHAKSNVRSTGSNASNRVPMCYVVASLLRRRRRYVGTSSATSLRRYAPTSYVASLLRYFVTSMRRYVVGFVCVALLLSSNEVTLGCSNAVTTGATQGPHGDRNGTHVWHHGACTWTPQGRHAVA